MILTNEKDKWQTVLILLSYGLNSAVNKSFVKNCWYSIIKQKHIKNFQFPGGDSRI
jgi:hypothetical protein